MSVSERPGAGGCSSGERSRRHCPRVQAEGAVTVVVRPEHAQAVSGGSTLNGVVDNVVYFGTDTHFHVRLDDGEPFIVRQQNARGGGPASQSATASASSSATTPPRC
jgi:ABC-type Fe3+/spermidine/putrescine transport system ATPase subunit